MKVLYNWLIVIFQKLFTKGGLPAQTEEKKPFVPHLGPLDLQFFAAGDDDSGDDDGDDSNDDDQNDEDDSDDEDDIPDLDELLKDPVFKKQYNARFKEQLAKRMKRHNKELERLKGDKKQDKGDDKGADDDDQTRINEKRLLRAERREKRAIVKEFAVDNGHNPRLLARLIDLDEIELDEDGEPENLDELFEDLEEEFPEYFGADKDDNEDEEEEEWPRKKRFTPGARQKMNKKKKVDPREAGRQKALDRHKKKEEN